MEKDDKNSEPSQQALYQKIDHLEKELTFLKAQIHEHIKAHPGLASDSLNVPSALAAEKPARPSSVGNISAILKFNHWLEDFKNRHKNNWEMLIGGNLLGKLGLLALILATAWFVKMAFDKRWINESGRIVLGLMFGFSTMTLSEFLAKRRLPALPAAIMGAGAAMLYIALYSGYYFYDLLTGPETFSFLAILCLMLALLSYHSGLQSIYLLSLVGSMLAPLLLSQGENSYRFLFSYMLVINLVFFFLSWKYIWQLSSVVITLANTLVFAVWAASNLTISSFGFPFAFVLLTFILFMAREAALVPRSGKIPVLNLILLFYHIFIFTLLGAILFDYFYPRLMSHFLLASSALLLAFSQLFEKKGTVRLAPVPSKEINLWIGLVLLASFSLLTSSFSRFTDGPWVQMMLLTLAGGLSLMAAMNRNTKIATLSFIAWFFALWGLHFSWQFQIGEYPLIHQRFFLYLFSSFMMAASYMIQRNRPLLFGLGKRAYLKGFIASALIILILGSFREVHDFVSDAHFRNLGYTYVLAFYTMILIAPGIIFSQKTLRLAGISVAVALLLKFYFYDIWTLSLWVRIIAGFSLGIGLLVTSLFYQKFRDKIMQTVKDNQGKSKNLMIILALLWLCLQQNNVWAAPEFRLGSFRYYKEIIQPLLANAEMAKKSQYGRIVLDKEISRYSGIHDIRIVRQGKPLPYFKREIPLNPKLSGFLKPELIYTKKEPKATVYVLKFPIPPEGSEFHKLELKSGGFYEASVSFQLGEKAGNWQRKNNASVYRYNDSSQEELQFRSGNMRFIRLVLDSTKEFSFPRVSFTPIKKYEEYKFQIPVKELQILTDSDKRATVIYYQNDYRRKINRLEIQFTETRFQRKVTLYSMISKKYVFLKGVSFLSKNKNSNRQKVEFPYGIATAFKIEIHNGDNPALNIQELSAFSNQEEVIFELSPKGTLTKEKEQLRIYYGNPYISRPEYDTKNLFSEKRQVWTYELAKHQENPDFSYYFLEPPMSTWIIKSLYILGILALIYPSFRIFKNYANQVKES